MLNTELTEYFRSNKDKLADRGWLTEAIRPHCRLKWSGWKRGSRLRVLQHPAEFADFLILMAEQNADSYLEIGTSSGGSFYLADSYLRASVPSYQFSMGFDRTDKMRSWMAYQHQNPNCQFLRTNSADIDLGNLKIGAGFIDARHIDKWVLQDFEKIRHNCRLIGFHDIVRGSVPIAWAKIKAQTKRHWEFIERDTPQKAWCGIGVVEV